MPKQKYVVRSGWFDMTINDFITNDNINEVAPRLEAATLEARLLEGHLQIINVIEEPAPPYTPGTPSPGADMVDGVAVSAIPPEEAQALALGAEAPEAKDTEPAPPPRPRQPRAHRSTQ